MQLKADFKKATGKDWKPGMKPEQPVLDTTLNNSVTVPEGADSKEILTEKITTQGNLVRDLKAKKANEVSCISKFNSFIFVHTCRKKLMLQLNYCWI